MPGPDLRLTIEEVARELAGLDYAAAQRSLQSVYRLAWLNLMQEVDRAMRSGAKPVAQVSRLLSSVTRTMRAADRGAVAWMSRYIPAAYSAGMKQADVQMALQGLRLGAPDSMAGVHMGAVREVARDAMQDLLAATQRVEESVKAAVRKVAREEIMTQVATGKRASGKRIAERMAEEEVYGVHDKRGRFIPMEEYARMVSHVKLRETHTKGMEGLIQEHGFDLVQISHHVHKPDICTPIEGKVYSITGNTPGWPKLPRHTPFHVGCRHVETPFVDTFLSDEKIAELQALSNQAEPVYTYTPEQLARADAKRAQRERGRKLRKARERKDAAAVASGKKKPVQAVKEEVAAEESLVREALVRDALESKPRDTPLLSSAKDGLLYLKSLHNIQTPSGRRVTFTERSVTHVLSDHGTNDAKFRLRASSWAEEAMRNPTFAGIQMRSGYPVQVWYAKFQEGADKDPKHVFVYARTDGEDLVFDSVFPVSSIRSARKRLSELTPGYL